MRICSFGVRALVCALVCGAPAAAQAQDVDVKRELMELRQALAEVRAELAALKAAHGAEAAAPAPSQDPALELLRAQVAELAQTKVESTSRFPVRLFGTVHAHMFGNTDTPNWMDLPNLANPT